MTKQAWLRLPVFVLLWLLFIAIKLPTIIIGFFVVPFMWQWREVDYKDLPRKFRPWANPEDWYGGPKTFEKTSLPKWWVDKNGFGEWSFYRYHAIRNPANGLRSYEFLDLDIEMDKVKYVTPALLTHYEPWHMRKLDPIEDAEAVPTIWYLCWQGWKAGFKVVHLWHDSYTRTRKTLEGVGPIWKLFTPWDWRIVEVTKTYSSRHLVIKLGWRIQPQDAHTRIDPEGIRVEDAGFATKGLPYRKG